jgi:branched-chain amino acid transport system substrate-binding protein
MGAASNYQVPVIQWAVDKLNAAGGLLGRQVQLEYLDDQADPSVVVQKANTLKGDGCVAIMGCWLDPQNAVLDQWATDNKFPVSSHMSTMDARTTGFSRYVFFDQPTGWTYAQLFSQMIAKMPEVKTIYTIAADFSLTHNIHDALLENLKTLDPGVKDLGADWVSMSETDFSAHISTILAKKPDIVYDGVGGPPAANFFQQAKQLDLFSQIKLFGLAFTSSDVTAPFGKDFPQGILTDTMCPFWLDTPEMKEFTQGILAKTNLYPADISIQDYVDFLAITTAIKKANSTDPEKIVDAWENMTIDNSPIGSFTYRSFDHQPNVPLWTEATGNSPDFPIAVGVNMVKYQDSIYPTQDQVTAWRNAK